MRIIAGKLKGKKVKIPKNKKTRPLKDLVKESIFNLLMHSNKITFQLRDSNILDLYAGSGSFGLECISRSAKTVCFVEEEINALKTLKENIKKLKVEKNTKIFSSDVLFLLKKKNIFKYKFDLIFCDPPYKYDSINKLIELIFENSLLSKNGVIIFHRNKLSKEQFPNYFKLIDERIYGISKIFFGKILY